MDAVETRSRLRDWIQERANGKIEGELTDETPLLESGILTSLDVTELIVYVEYLRGEEIDIERLEPGLLRNVSSMYAAFFD